MSNSVDLTLTPSQPLLPVSSESQVMDWIIALTPTTKDAFGHTISKNYTLLADTSYSMKSRLVERLPIVITQIFHHLASSDIYSVVAFNDTSTVLLEAKSKCEYTVIMMQVVKQAIFSGGTDLYQGLVAAATLNRLHRRDEHLNQIILVSDGHTYGDQAACLAFAQQLAEEGISISVLGLGADWDDVFLEQLSQPSRGEMAYLSSPSSVLNLLRRSEQKRLAWMDLTLQIGLDEPRGVVIRDLFQFQPFAEILTLDASKQVTWKTHIPTSLLVRLVIPPQTEPRRLVLGQVVIQTATGEILSQELVVQVAVHPPASDRPSIIREARSQRILFDELAQNVSPTVTYEKQVRANLATHFEQLGEANIADYLRNT